MTTLTIPDHMRDRFNTLVRAARNGDLALMSCLDAQTSEPRFVMCAANRESNGAVTFVPIGHLTPNDNPYDAYIPPEQANG